MKRKILDRITAKYNVQGYILLILVMALAACGPAPSLTTPTGTAAPSPEPVLSSPTPTITPLPPTSTPVPLAALVNGEALPLAEFQAELKRFRESGTKLASEHAEDAEQYVLNELINQMLLSQAATQAGYSLDESALQARIDQLAAQAGGIQALEEWMHNHQYTPEEFRTSLRRSLTAAWMRDQIIAAVPEAAEQVHARQILLYNSQQADEVLMMLQRGQDFARLAQDYDPIHAGDLGWFPRGYLNDPALEEAAFALQPGQYSQVIQTRLGYCLIQVIEREAQRSLSPDQRLILQEQALSAWIQRRREQSDIQIFLP